MFEVFRNFEVSEKVDDKGVRLPRWVKVKPPQPSYHNSMRWERQERTISPIPPITKVNSTVLGQKWYIVGKDGRPIRKMRASMISRVQR